MSFFTLNDSDVFPYPCVRANTLWDGGPGIAWAHMKTGPGERRGLTAEELAAFKRGDIKEPRVACSRCHASKLAGDAKRQANRIWLCESCATRKRLKMDADGIPWYNAPGYVRPLWDILWLLDDAFISRLPTNKRKRQEILALVSKLRRRNRRFSDARLVFACRQRHAYMVKAGLMKQYVPRWEKAAKQWVQRDRFVKS